MYLHKSPVVFGYDRLSLVDCISGCHLLVHFSSFSGHVVGKIVLLDDIFTTNTFAFDVFE